MAANVALVILTNLICSFCGGFVAGALAGFAAAFFRLPHLMALTGLLAIPLTVGAGYFAGRWIARRQSPPTTAEIIVGCVVYTSASTVLVALAHPAVAVVSLIANAATSLVLYRSAQHTGLGAVVTANNA